VTVERKERQMSGRKATVSKKVRWRRLWPQRLKHEQPVLPVLLVAANKPTPAVPITADPPRPCVQAFGLEMSFPGDVHAEGAGADAEEVVAF
jgi:hypothetical protein